MPSDASPCPHRIDPATCPACSQGQRDGHEADRLASHDPQPPDELRDEFDVWTADPDSQRAYWGDCWPAITPEVP